MQRIKEILNQQFPYLDATKDKLVLIGFVGIFILLFLSVYAPFNMNQWGDSLYLGYVGIGSVVLLMTQFVLRPLLGFTSLKVYSFVVWFIAELLLITIGIYLAYSPELTTWNDKLYEYFLTLRYVVLILVAPYILVIWYLSVRYKFTLTEKNGQNQVAAATQKNNTLLNITGENNKVVLAIDYAHLLFVKSSGNYLEIHYLKGERAAKEVVRMSLKELESKIDESSIIRIHRSYVVNIHQIASFKKTRKGYALLVKNNQEETLPVSSSYKDGFEESLELKMTH